MECAESISESKPSDVSSRPEALKDEVVSEGFIEGQKRCLWASLNDFILLLRLLLEQLGSVGLPKQAYVDWSKKEPLEALELIVMEAPHPPLVYPGNREEDAPADPLVLELKDTMVTRVAHLLRCIHEAEKPQVAGSKGGPRGAEGKRLSHQRSALSGNYQAGTSGGFVSAAYAIPFQQQLLQQQVIQQQMACYLQRQQHASQDISSYSQLPVSALPMPFPSVPCTRQHTASVFWNGFSLPGHPPGTPFVAPHWSLLAAQRPVGNTAGAAPASAYAAGSVFPAYSETTHTGAPQRHPASLPHWPREAQPASSPQLVFPVRYWRPAVTVSQCGSSDSNIFVGARGPAAGNWPSRSSPFGMPGGFSSNIPYSHGIPPAMQTVSTAAQACNSAYAPLSVGTQHSTCEPPPSGSLANGLPQQRPSYP